MISQSNNELCHHNHDRTLIILQTTVAAIFDIRLVQSIIIVIDHIVDRGRKVIINQPRIQLKNA